MADEYWWHVTDTQSIRVVDGKVRMLSPCPMDGGAPESGCLVCQGTGHMEQWVPLADIVAHLLRMRDEGE